MQIGTQVPEVGSWEEVFSSLSRANIHHIELGPEILPSFSLPEAAELSHLLKNQGIMVYSVHAPFGDEANLSIPEEYKRKKAVVSHREVIEKMQVFESSILVVHPGEKAKKGKIHHRVDLFCRSLKELLPCAEENKTTLALENMPPGFVGSSAQELKYIIEDFNSPYLGVCFDTGHSYIGGKLQHDFELLQPYIVTFHIHDNDGLRDLHLQPPYGAIPWENFTRWVECLSFPHPLIMECFPWGRVEFEWVKKEVELLFQGKIIQNASSPPGYIRCPSCGHFLFEYEGKPHCYCSLK